MTSIAVIAHRKKLLGGGLDELREILANHGYPNPLWYEASKSRETGKLAKKAVADGAQLIFLWGGDGTVQRCVNAVVNCEVELAILPAGTANLLATNLGIPIHLARSVEVGLNGVGRRLDVGVLNDKCFAVMAGIGIDAVVMEKVDSALKDRLGRFAYFWTGIRALRFDPLHAVVRVDGEEWFTGRATCILIGQMNSIGGSVSVFPEGQPDDGVVEVGVVTAQNVREWFRVLARLATNSAHLSPLTKMTQGHDIDVVLDRATPYELDGGARKAQRHFTASVKPGAITVRVPRLEL